MDQNKKRQVQISNNKHRKRAKVNKNHVKIAAEPRRNEEAISRGIAALNVRFTAFMLKTLESDQFYDFRETILMYKDAVNILEKSESVPLLMDPANIHAQRSVSSALNLPNKNIRHALSSIYGLNKRVRCSNNIMSMLDQEFEIPDEEPETFNYLNLKDVVKSKGNSINGPKREDVGNFNRKLFIKYSKEISNTLSENILVNFNFCDFVDMAILKDRILACEFITINSFGCDISLYLDDFLLIIYEIDNTTFISCMNKKHVVFDKVGVDAIQAAYDKKDRKITVLYLDTFNLFEMFFKSNLSAKRAFELFFKTTCITNESEMPFDLSHFI